MDLGSFYVWTPNAPSPNGSPDKEKRKSNMKSVGNEEDWEELDGGNGVHTPWRKAVDKAALKIYHDMEKKEYFLNVEYVSGVREVPGFDVGRRFPFFFFSLLTPCRSLTLLSFASVSLSYITFFLIF